VKPPSGARSAAPSGAAALAAGLPDALRTPVQRYPVTLLSTPDCIPCDNGRRLLQQRGIPYLEKRVVSEEDGQALERLMGARTVPALMIGTQPLRGYADADWHNFLDAAGYPRESRLPKGWKAADATPLAERVAVPPAPAQPQAAARAAAPREAAAPPGLPASGGIRF
jgi:glutaredoxin